MPPVAATMASFMCDCFNERRSLVSQGPFHLRSAGCAEIASSVPRRYAHAHATCLSLRTLGPLSSRGSPEEFGGRKYLLATALGCVCPDAATVGVSLALPTAGGLGKHEHSSS